MKLNTYQFHTTTGWSTPLDSGFDSSSTLVVVFGPSEINDYLSALDELASVFSNSVIVGCSSAGEIYDTHVDDGTLSVAVMKFEHCWLKLFQTDFNTSEETLFATIKLAKQLDEPDLKAVFVLSDGLHINGTQLIDGFNKLSAKGVTVTGGLAGDGSRFEKTWVLIDGKPKDHFISAVGLYGEHLDIRHGSKGGWDILEENIEVTHSIGNILYELNDEPALDFYKRYLGDKADGLPGTGLLFPLALKKDVGEKHEVTVRTILGIDEEEKSLIFAGSIPDGSQVNLMQANFDGLIEGARMASDFATSKTDQNRPYLCLAISCVGRRLVLEDRTSEELDAVFSKLPDGSKQIGFYSYGEISPLSNGYCDLHNQTMTLTLISEK